MTITPIQPYSTTKVLANPVQAYPTAKSIPQVFSNYNAQSNNTYVNFDFENTFSFYPYNNINCFGQALSDHNNDMFNVPFNIYNQTQNQMFFNMPSTQFNISNFDFTSQLYQNKFLNITRPLQTQTNTTSNTKNTKNADGIYSPSGKKDLAYWKSLGYDEQKGKELAKDAVANCAFKWDHQCAKYSRETLNRVYKTNIVSTKDKPNWGCKFGHNILERPELKGKFKCIKLPNGIKPEDIPDGAYLIWPGSAFGKGAAAKYGHVATAYQGKPYSDNVGCNTLKCNEIWIPVKAQA